MGYPQRLHVRFQEGGISNVLQGIADFVRYRMKGYLAVPLGTLVELRGDQVTYFGVQLDLSSDAIESPLKSRFPLKVYEREEVELIREYLPRQSPVIELGGGIGFISCFVDQLLRDADQLVLEANPSLIEPIRRNRTLNDATFEVQNAAYSSSSQTVEFFVHSKFVGGSAQRATDTSVEVEGHSLEELSETVGGDDVTLIVDIEGGEFDLIDNELHWLREHCRTLFVEFHDFTGEDVNAYRQRLVRNGFDEIDRNNGVSVLLNEGIE